MKRKLFHGTKRRFDMPTFGIGNIHNDYGVGFYLCFDIDLAIEWANKDFTPGYVNEYEIDDDNLRILDLTSSKYSILNWIAIIFHFRNKDDYDFGGLEPGLEFLDQYYIDVTQYDIVIGYRADDAYFDFPIAFLRNNILLESLKEVYELGELGLQYVLISPKAFHQIKYIGYKDCSKNDVGNYEARVDDATKQYKMILDRDNYKDGTRLRDLIKDAYKNRN